MLAPMTYFYTAVYGDHIKLPEFDGKGFEFRCYTDREIESKTWKVYRDAASRPTGDQEPHPRMAAKWHKMFPQKGDPGDISIWIDASITVTDVEEMVRACTAALEGHDVALFKHPERTDIFQEAAVSKGMSKYAGLPLLEQVT